MFISTHSQRLERWLGPEIVEQMSTGMRGWYGPPIPLFGVPGNVYATGDGDFVGAIKGGFFGALADYGTEKFKRICRNWSREQMHTAGMGFSSLSDLISEATTGGKAQTLTFKKDGVAVAAVGQSVDMWGSGGTLPAQGAAAANLAGGTNYTSANSSALKFIDPAGGDTLHLTTMTVQCNTTGTMMLYDRLWAGNASLQSTSQTGINMSLTRYANSTSNAAGNFIAPVVNAYANATATNLTINYSNQAGSANANSAAVAFRVSSANHNIGLAATQWFIPLNAGDYGVSNMSAVYSSGAQNAYCSWVCYHPLALVPTPVANMPFILDGINSAFNLVQIWPAACMSFIDWNKTVTGAAAYAGLIQVVSG